MIWTYLDTERGNKHNKLSLEVILRLWTAGVEATPSQLPWTQCACANRNVGPTRFNEILAPRSPVAGYGGFGSAGMLRPQMLVIKNETTRQQRWSLRPTAAYGRPSPALQVMSSWVYMKKFTLEILRFTYFACHSRTLTQICHTDPRQLVPAWKHRKNLPREVWSLRSLQKRFSTPQHASLLASLLVVSGNTTCKSRGCAWALTQCWKQTASETSLVLEYSIANLSLLFLFAHLAFEHKASARMCCTHCMRLLYSCSLV